MICSGIETSVMYLSIYGYCGLLRNLLGSSKRPFCPFFMAVVSGFDAHHSYSINRNFDFALQIVSHISFGVDLP